MKSIFILFFSLTANANLICSNLFEDVSSPSIVSAWLPRIEKELLSTSYTPSVFRTNTLDKAKVDFLETQKNYLDQMFREGIFDINDLAYAKIISVRDMDSQQSYHLIGFPKATFLFSIDGNTPPVRLTGSPEVGYLAHQRPTRLESDTITIILSNGRLQIQEKTNAVANAKNQMPELFSSPNYSFLGHALRKQFTTQIETLLNDKKITKQELDVAEVMVSNYSDATFILIPNSKRSDHYVISTIDGSIHLLTELPTRIHGYEFYTSSGNKIILQNGVGFLPTTKVKVVFNSFLANAITATLRQTEFILQRDLSNTETNMISSSIRAAMQSGLNPYNIEHSTAFLKDFNQTQLFVLGNIAISAYKNLFDNAQMNAARQQAALGN